MKQSTPNLSQEFIECDRTLECFEDDEDAQSLRLSLSEDEEDEEEIPKNVNTLPEMLKMFDELKISFEAANIDITNLKKTEKDLQTAFLQSKNKIQKNITDYFFAIKN